MLQKRMEKAWKRQGLSGSVSNVAEPFGEYQRKTTKQRNLCQSSQKQNCVFIANKQSYECIRIAIATAVSGTALFVVVWICEILKGNLATFFSSVKRYIEHISLQWGVLNAAWSMCHNLHNTCITEHLAFWCTCSLYSWAIDSLMNLYHVMLISAML